MKRIGIGLATASLAALGFSVATAQQNSGQAQARANPQAAQPVQVDRNILHVQVILDHLGFGPGVLDGRGGMSLVAALKGFQESRGLPVTGKPDQATLRALHPYAGWRPTRTLRLSEGALRGEYINPLPKEPEDQARLPAMAYRAPIEKLAEMFHTTPQVLAALNPQGRLQPGAELVFPNALPTSRAYPQDIKPEWRQTLTNLNVDAKQPQGETIVVDESDAVLRVLDGNGRLVGQFQATMGSERDPLPLGNWKVTAISPNPDWKFQPKILKKVSDAKSEQLIPAGPNNPVGVVWIDLSKEHYGIHGTAEPHQIGRAESNGCVRLTNWDAARVALMVKPGAKVVFQA